MSEDISPEKELQVLRGRVVELEMRSEERRQDCEALRSFVDGYERRIRALERQLSRMKEQLENPAEPLPAPLDDLPPHY